MITEAIWHAVSTVIGAAFSLMPSMTTPAWVSSISDTVTSGVGPFMQLDHWIPIGPIGVVLTFTFLAWSIAVGVRLTRIAISMFTGGGGST